MHIFYVVCCALHNIILENEAADYTLDDSDFDSEPDSDSDCDDDFDSGDCHDSDEDDYSDSDDETEDDETEDDETEDGVEGDSKNLRMINGRFKTTPGRFLANMNIVYKTEVQTVI